VRARARAREEDPKTGGFLLVARIFDIRGILAVCGSDCRSDQRSVRKIAPALNIALRELAIISVPFAAAQLRHSSRARAARVISRGFLSAKEEREREREEAATVSRARLVVIDGSIDPVHRMNNNGSRVEREREGVWFKAGGEWRAKSRIRL